MKAPLEVPLPAPLPEPPPLPEPLPEPLDGDAQGSLGALDDEVGDALLPGVVPELALAVAVGAGVAAPALSGCDRDDMPCSRLKPVVEVVGLGEADDEAPADGDPDPAGTRPLVRSQMRDCTEGDEPEGDPLGVGDAPPSGPEPEAATATAAGVRMTAVATADSPIVNRFIESSNGVALGTGTSVFAYPAALPENGPENDAAHRCWRAALSGHTAVMTQPMRDALSNLQDHLPNVDLDAVRDHLPSLKDVEVPSLKAIEASAVVERVRSKARSKWSIAALVAGLLAGGTAAAAYLRRRRQPVSTASMYTPPLPKP